MIWCNDDKHVCIYIFHYKSGFSSVTPTMTLIQGDFLARGPKLLSIKNYVNQLTDDELTTGYYQQDGATCHASNASMREIESFFSRQNYLKKPLATQIYRSNACRLLSLGPIEGQKCTKIHPTQSNNSKTLYDKRLKPSTSTLRESIPEIGETHSSVLGCERRPVSASIMSRSCFSSFPVCVYKFSSHYLNNIIFYRQ